jgi:hypothetical protein
MKRKPIDVDELKKTFRINNGKLERIDLRRTDGKWKVVENKSNDGQGYCLVNFNGILVRYHVIIWILSTGKDIPDGMQIDHKNGNKLCSTMNNMRLVTNRQNSQNKKIHRAGRLAGTYYNKIYHNDKIYHYWRSQIAIDKTRIGLGCYKTEQEAHEAYKIACKHITNYVDNKSFRELVKKEMENNNGR